MQVDGLVLVLEHEHRLVELLMRRVIEIVGLDLGEHRVDRLVVEQQGRENGLLGFEIVRRNAARDAFCGRLRACHGTPPTACSADSTPT